MIRVGTTVKEQLENDLKLETDGVVAYNKAVDLCLQLKDGGSRDLLETILVESEEHVDWVETQLDIISHIGMENYLQSQLGDEAAG